MAFVRTEKAISQNDERCQNPTRTYHQEERKIENKIKGRCKDAKGKEVKEEIPVFADGDALDLCLNTIFKLDVIKS